MKLGAVGRIILFNAPAQSSPLSQRYVSFMMAIVEIENLGQAPRAAWMNIYQ